MLKNLRLGTKLISGYVCVALIIVAVAVMGYLNSRSMYLGMKTLYDDRVLPLQQLGAVGENINKLWSDINRLALIPDDHARIGQNIAREMAEIKKQTDLYRATYLIPEEKSGLTEFDAAWPVYQKAIAEVEELIKAGNKEAAMHSLVNGGRAANARKAVAEPVEKLVAVQVRVSEEISKEGAASFAGITMSSIAGASVGLLLALGLGVAIARSITRPMERTVNLLREMSLGRLGGRLEMDRRDEIGVMAGTMDKFAEDLQRIVVRGMKRIAEGDLSIEVVPKDDADEIAPALRTIVDSLRGLVAESKMLTRAAVNGQLSVRGNADRFQGGYGEIVQGVNQTLDALTGPMNVAAAYVDRISKGDIPSRITDDYKGDFNAIKNNLNLLIDAMNEVTSIAEEIAAGNLTVAVRERSAEDKLMQALSRMVSGLSDIVSNIQTVAGQVMSGSQEMSSTAEQISSGATEQSASVEEVSASMEEMTANISQNSENAQQTEKIALKAADDARQGGKAVVETVSAMKQIAGKICIIEEIARQTDLLALNAAIEAARAGEHGKGFAVVASEVRKLAERSQTAAGEISNLAVSSVQVAENAGAMLDKIVPDIQKTADLVQEINAASNEQNAGAVQINQAVQQLDAVIQQNASASEEMAGMSEELLGQAEQLLGAIGYFRIGDMADSGANAAVSQFTAKKTAATGYKSNRAPAAGDKHAVNTTVRRIAAHGNGGTRPAANKDNKEANRKGVALTITNEPKGRGKDRLDDEFENY